MVHFFEAKKSCYGLSGGTITIRSLEVFGASKLWTVHKIQCFFGRNQRKLFVYSAKMSRRNLAWTVRKLRYGYCKIHWSLHVQGGDLAVISGAQ